MTKFRVADLVKWKQADKEAPSPMFCAGVVKKAFLGVDYEGDPKILNLQVKFNNNGNFHDPPHKIMMTSFSVRMLATNHMEPGPDNQIWSYLPSWFFEPEHAVNAINYITTRGLRLPLMNDFDSRPEATTVRKPYAQTLRYQHRRGALGRYTPRDFNSPKTMDGTAIYKLVIDSCTVRPTSCKSCPHFSR